VWGGGEKVHLAVIASLMLALVFLWFVMNQKNVVCSTNKIDIIFVNKVMKQ